MSTNIAILTGRLTADPEGRWVEGRSGQRLMASFRLAVNRNYKNANGEREADFLNVVISGHKAERLCEWARKGSLVTVTGSIKTRNYENNDGQRVYITEIDADNIDYLDPRQDNGQGQGYNQGYSQGYDNGYQQQGGGYQQRPPQQQRQQRGNYQQQGGGYQQQTPNFGRDPQPQGQQQSFFKGQTTNPMDISDDDLPF